MRKKLTIEEEFEKTVNEFRCAQDVEIAIMETERALNTAGDLMKRATLMGMLSVLKKTLREHKQDESRLAKIKEENREVVDFSNKIAMMITVQIDLILYYHDMYVAIARSLKIDESSTFREAFRAFRSSCDNFRKFLRKGTTYKDRQANSDLEVRFMNYIRKNILSKEERVLYDRYDEIAGNY